MMSLQCLMMTMINGFNGGGKGLETRGLNLGT